MQVKLPKERQSDKIWRNGLQAIASGVKNEDYRERK